MRLDEIPAKGPELFPNTVWSVTEPDQRTPWEPIIVRAELTIFSQVGVTPEAIAWSRGDLLDYVVNDVGRKIEAVIDQRSKAAKEWRERAEGYREMMRNDPRTWMPL